MYIDERLVIPKALRPIIIRSLHYGHPGRDTMLATVSNILWPRLHRELVSLFKTCPQCQDSGKKLKPIITQKQFGKLPKPSEINQEITIEFAGPIQNAPKAKQSLLVSNKYPFLLIVAHQYIFILFVKPSVLRTTFTGITHF